ncbi:MAG: SAM-dependent methyltransferase [Hydrogenophaga sp.]|uniref:SAM-dependent methyltransferase n=1 Tax=Hydrogenophaga sp. TaxID=1904254 RepID=UPI001DD4FF81|nr:SAM-dependent methyltransferase [Hydrogenophaga sp.]MBX3609113.1 SAM-dependent methyltransferase [Hydrogenophaga sp.]
MRTGRLLLVPTPLDFGAEAQPLAHSLPGDTIATAAGVSHWIVENAKSARAFLKRVDALHPLDTPLQSLMMTELPRQAHKRGDHQAGALDEAARPLLAPALQGHDVGLLSEAGMPAVADPGSSVVRAAHALGLEVVPLIGPVSLMLALAASGLNGQRFAFVGYVPQDPVSRARELRDLDSQATRSGQTQIVIETPYRNTALLHSLVDSLNPRTRLAAAFALGGPQQTVRSALVSEWRQAPPWRSSLPMDQPCVFLFGP